jgi:hypothetical protein
MAARDYKAEYQRRIARGLTRAQARGHASSRKAKSTAPSKTDPQLNAAILEMNRGRSLTAAAKSSHISADRLEQHYRRLGTHEPRCVICGKSDPRCLEEHHIAGRGYHNDTAIVCRNCHRIGVGKPRTEMTWSLLATNSTSFEAMSWPSSTRSKRICKSAFQLPSNPETRQVSDLLPPRVANASFFSRRTYLYPPRASVSDA